MHLTILAVPGCPNAVLLEERVTSVLADHGHVTVSRHLITTAEEATRWGMHGSPTILVNGTDPFGGPGQAASMSCRLYRDTSGRITGAPSTAQLRRAIEQAAEALPARLVRRPSPAHRHTPPTLAAQWPYSKAPVLCATYP